MSHENYLDQEWVKNLWEDIPEKKDDKFDNWKDVDLVFKLLNKSGLHTGKGHPPRSGFSDEQFQSLYDGGVLDSRIVGGLEGTNNPAPDPPSADDTIKRTPETTFLENYVPKTVDKEVKNKWGKVVNTEYTKDISDTYTTEILGDRGKKWGIDAEEAQAIETSFIDSVYGTKGAYATTWGEGTRAWDDPESGYDSTWGLDLRRVYDADLKAGTPAMTDHLTKGPIDYAHYLKDPNYKAAFERLGYDLSLEGISDSRKASMIREARQTITTDKGGTKELVKKNKVEGDTWLHQIINRHADKKYETDDDGNLLEPTEWKGMYNKNKIYTVLNPETGKKDLYIDDIKQKGILEQLESGEGRYDPTTDKEWQRDKIKKDNYIEREFDDLSTKEYRATLNLPSRESLGLSIRRREGGPPVERPTNIPKSRGKV